MMTDNGTTRKFDTGSSRNTAENKYDYEGFLCPLVIERYAEYMHKNRHMADGSFRDSDNWQKGIPLDVYMKSAWRHFFDMRKLHRTGEGKVVRPDGEEVDIEEAIAGLMFNIMGYLHEYLKSE